jgi:hypothetical protein
LARGAEVLPIAVKVEHPPRPLFHKAPSPAVIEYVFSMQHFRGVST